MDRDEVEVHKLANKKRGQYPAILTSHLVNKGFIIWLLGKFCLRDTAGSPERARWLRLARSGSQSQRAIWFILHAGETSHIIIINNVNMKKFAWRKCWNIFPEAIFSHSRKLLQSFRLSIFVIILRDWLGKFRIVIQPIIAQNYDV